MRIPLSLVVSATALLGFGVGWSAGCASSDESTGSTNAPIGASATASSSMCPACLSDTDCAGGEACAQFQGDLFCAPRCSGDQACASGRTCSTESAFNGDELSVCVPDGNVCGSSSGPDAKKSKCDAGSPTMCGTLVGPTVNAGCSGCSKGSSGCQDNGCYNSWWCDTATDRCQAPPTKCKSTCDEDAGAADAGMEKDSGEPVDSGKKTDAGPSKITGSGGTMGTLQFAIVGDTRPANEDDTAGYPTAIIQKIFQDLEAAGIPFEVSTGDYQYANPTGTQSKPQLELYMAARAMYSGVAFPAMGNHECTGYTDSNCGPGSSSGDTSNYDNFLSLLLAPNGQTEPYYVINIDATDGSWTSKFVFIAANAWNSTQSAWLTKALAVSTTYTFVIRHEATEANTAPGVTPSDTIIAKYPLTLEINGHTHTYEWSATNKVIVGNGGAPVTGGVDYGYGVVQQQTNGDVTVDMIDYKTGAADSSFHREFTAAGAEVK